MAGRLVAAKPILAVDVHGVLARFGSFVLDTINDRHGTAYTDDDCDSYYFRDCAGLGEHAQEADDVCNQLMHDGWVYGALAPYTGAIECCRALAVEYDLWAVTHVTPNGIVPVVKWLWNYGFPFSCVFPVMDPREKTAIALQTQGLIEDRAKTVNDCTAAGVRCYLVDRAWNRTAPLHPFVVRGTLGEITRTLLRLR